MNVGLLFPGEMGAAVGGKAIRGRVLWASEGRSAATATRASGFEDAGTVAELVARSDVVLSVCPPGIAEAVARDVAAASLERWASHRDETDVPLETLLDELRGA
ncbi:MAG TPA: hypothetical protein VGJ25_10265 [Gaiellaceae bacterium]